MKKLCALVLVLLFSCNKSKLEITDDVIDFIPSENLETISNQFNWEGLINNEAKIFLNYEIKNDLIFGEIIYLNTDDKFSKKIYGQIEKYDDNESYRLLEFDTNGNISSIFTGVPSKTEFTGEWFSPKTRETQSILLKPNTVAFNFSNEVKIEDIFGEYYYQYGSTEGALGTLFVKKIENDKMIIELVAVTDEPARNIAEFRSEPLPISTNFIYKIPDTENCEMRIEFYNQVAFITYTEGNICMYEFGHNASAEGIFLKKK